VSSFGSEWNHFNYDAFKINWLEHVVKNTFGTPDIFKGKIIVDAGGGSGMQSVWMSECGAAHVICLELSQSVDDVLPRNVAKHGNIDVVQCTIDRPPLRKGCIQGLVICHNVIQHTPSVAGTARALWDIVGPRGEFVFNCYTRNDQGILRALRFAMGMKLRQVLSRQSFDFLLTYSRMMAAARFIPGLGLFLEKSGFLSRGHIPSGPHYLRRAFRQASLNTFDAFGSHTYQHYLSNDEVRAIVNSLQPDPALVLNLEKSLGRPAPIGCALRLLREKA
jgi:SAM-dependent methyltransferase